MLVDLMIHYRVGVQIQRAYVTLELDQDYFENSGQPRSSTSAGTGRLSGRSTPAPPSPMGQASHRCGWR